MGRKKQAYVFSKELRLNGYVASDSSNIEFFAWAPNGLYVQFKGAQWYLYEGVTRQRVVAMSRSKSAGVYLNEKIKPNYKVTKLEWPSK